MYASLQSLADIQGGKFNGTLNISTPFCYECVKINRQSSHPAYLCMSASRQTHTLLKRIGFFAQFALIGLGVAFLVLWFKPEWLPQANQAEPAKPQTSAEQPTQTPATTQPAPVTHSFATAVKRAAPSVVSIYADKIVTERPIQLNTDEALQRFSGLTLGPPRRRVERALGSGVIVSSDGYVLTNHHVIQGARDIRIALSDGRVTRATLVGSDRETDLAVLNMEGDQFPAVDLTAAAAPQVGDVVLAIGNPFGLGQTVTQGIVSAMGRDQLNLTTYDDFIQTDAAINEGNSGGALVNVAGDVIGINTFALGRLRTGAEGISFAIPKATANMVMNQIIEHGYVIRGWLGLEYGDATLQNRMSGVFARGVVVARVYEASPAAQAGIQPGDILLSVNGMPVENESQLRDMEASLSPGTQITVSALRNGMPVDVTVTLSKRPVFEQA